MANGLFETPDQVSQRRSQNIYSQFLAGSQTGGGGATLGAGIGALLSGLFNRGAAQRERQEAGIARSIYQQSLEEAGGDQVKGLQLAARRLLDEGMIGKAQMAQQQAQKAVMAQLEMDKIRSETAENRADTEEALASAQKSLSEIQVARQRLANDMRKTDIKAQRANTYQQRADTYERKAQEDIKLARKRLELYEQRIKNARSDRARNVIKNAREQMIVDTTKTYALSTAKQLALRMANEGEFPMTPQDIMTTMDYNTLISAIKQTDPGAVENWSQKMNDFMAQINPESRFERRIFEELEGLQNSTQEDEVDIDLSNQ